MRLNIKFKDNSDNESSFKIYRATDLSLSDKVEIISLSYSNGWTLSGSNDPILKSSNSAPSQTGEIFSIDFDEDQTGSFFYGVGAFNLVGGGSAIEGTLVSIQVGTTTIAPTTLEPTTLEPTTLEPTTLEPTTLAPTTLAPTTLAPTTLAPTTIAPTTIAPTTLAPTTLAPTTLAPTTIAPTTIAPTTLAPTTLAPTTLAPTTIAPTTIAPTTLAPETICVTCSSYYLSGSFTFTRVGETTFSGGYVFPIYEGVHGSLRPQVKIESHPQSPSNIRWVLTYGNGTTTLLSYSWMGNQWNYKSSVPTHPKDVTGWQINSVSIVDGSC